MSIQKFKISRDPKLYEAWPDLVLANDGTMIVVFSECKHHHDRSYTRIMLTESSDRGRTWTAPHPLTEAGTAEVRYFYNCARIVKLRDGRLVVSVDCCHYDGFAKNYLYFSGDNGRTWGPRMEVPIDGIVPERLTELDNGRWLYAAHKEKKGCDLEEWLVHSDDCGKTWSPERKLAAKKGLNLCEVSLLPLGRGKIMAFLRENSMTGLDAFKVMSDDNGETWSEPIEFPLAGCHRPTSGFLNDGRVMITYRYHQGSEMTTPASNLFAALTDRESIQQAERKKVKLRVLPIDYDRNRIPDLGYTGWIQFDDGEIYIVTYIKDDSDLGQIRGYSLRNEDFSF